MNILLFGAFPYVAVVVFLIGTIWRYQTGYKYSSLSSQFLETKKLFFSSVPFHVGILVILLGHFVGYLWPSLFLAGGSDLITFEVTALAFALLAIVGLLSLIYRRFTNERVISLTTKMDMLLELLLLAQFCLGIYIAIELRWGSQWYAAVMVPYLMSITTFHPNLDAVSMMPVLVKLHIFGGFLIIFLIPFTRLVHFLVAPFHYITRPYQVVRWYWNRKKIRDVNTPWAETRPKRG